MARGKRRRVVKCKGGRFLVLLKGEGRRMSPRFHFFVSVVKSRDRRGRTGSRFSCVAPGIEKLSLDLT